MEMILTGRPITAQEALVFGKYKYFDVPVNRLYEISLFIHVWNAELKV